MRYLDEIRAFHEYILNHELSTGEIALWHALMGHNNRLGWLQEFSLSNLIAQKLTSLSRSALHNARQRLCEKGLLLYTPGEIHRSGTYQLISIYNLEENPLPLSKPPKIATLTTTQDTTQDTTNTPHETQTSTQTRQNSNTLTRVRPRPRQRERNVNVIPPPPFDRTQAEAIKRDLVAYVTSQLGESPKSLSGDLDFFLAKGIPQEEICVAINVAHIRCKPWYYAKSILTNQQGEQKNAKESRTGKGKRSDEPSAGTDERWRKGALY